MQPACGNRDRRIGQGACTGPRPLWRGIRISRPPSLALSLLHPFIITTKSAVAKTARYSQHFISDIHLQERPHPILSPTPCSKDFLAVAMSNPSMPPILPSDLIQLVLWAIIILVLAVTISYVLGCYVLEVNTELIDGGRTERTNQLLFFRKGPVKFIIGSHHVGRRVLQTTNSHASLVSGSGRQAG